MPSAPPQRELSIRTLTVAILLAMVALSSLHTLFAKQLFRDAALASEKRSLAHVIDVATQEVLRQARARARTLGHSLQARIRPPRNDLRALPDAQWSLILDEPFIKGFPNFHLIELAQLRVYDPELNWIAESGPGIEGLPSELPPFLAREAAKRSGAERYRALGGLWSPPHGAPLYSVVVPIGGLRLIGYLEVVITPLHNLDAIGDMVRRPFAIDNLQGETVRAPTSLTLPAEQMIRVSYPLHGDDGRLAYQLVTYLDQEVFLARMDESQLQASALFFGISLLVLLAALALFSRYLFQPIHRMINEIDRAMRSETLHPLSGEGGLREVKILSGAFNTLARQVHDSLQELKRLSNQDGLTGVANRRHFDVTLEHEWRRAARERTPISLLLIDVDLFKQYNDHLGHQAGDDCLRMIATTLQGTLQRPADLAARYGGEEFAVILPATTEVGALEVAARLKQACDDHRLRHPSSEVAAHVTLSVGSCTLIPDGEHGSDRLIRGADKALYQAKANGRDRIEAAA